jgi:hypothetical protein
MFQIRIRIQIRSDLLISDLLDLACYNSLQIWIQINPFF